MQPRRINLSMISIPGRDAYFFDLSNEITIRCDILHCGHNRPSLVSAHSLQYTVKHRTHLYKGVSISSVIHRGHTLLSKVHLPYSEYYDY